MINIKGLNKAEVLCRLYNASRPLGLGMIHYNPAPMEVEEAEELLKTQTYFDYLHGRVMKISLRRDEFDEGLYDRDNGEGAAKHALGDLL